MVKVISLEGWTDVMYIIQDTHSFYNFIYFAMVIVSFYTLLEAFNCCSRFPFFEESFYEALKL